MKECSNCKIEMELIEFNKKKETKDGFSSKCKICEKERAILWFNNNINIIKETKKKYYLNNKENLKEKNKKYYLNNLEKVKNKQKETAKLYYKNNKEKIIKRNIKNQKNRKLIDPLFKLSCNIRTLIWISLKKKYTKTSRTHQILGCSFEDFKIHLQSQFTKGMNWENAGEWHLDHIYPVSLAKSEEELIQLNHYTNFQPLWAKDNLQKGNKIIDNKRLKLI